MPALAHGTLRAAAPAAKVASSARPMQFHASRRAFRARPQACLEILSRKLSCVVPMSASDSKSLTGIGFLTVVELPQYGLCGGLLVVNAAARPLEFHCTAPVKADRAGDPLRPHAAALPVRRADRAGPLEQGPRGAGDGLHRLRTCCRCGPW